MAKWGQGDPRWIVEERPDAKNVNNWHWSERDASGWSQTKLKSLLVGLEFEGPEGTCQTTEVVSCKGEATANNRKGKLIFFYEWHIKLKWTGTCTPSTDASDPDLDGDDIKPKKYSGEIEIPNLSEEHEVDEIDVIVTAKKTSREAYMLKELSHRVAPEMIREQLSTYLKCLREEFSKGLILPPKGQETVPNNPLGSGSRQDSLGSNLDKTSSPASRASSSPIGCRIYTARVSLSDSFMAPIEEVYETLTTQERTEAFTRSKAVVENFKGGQYSILGGQITGEFVELERPTRIVMKWREKSWPDNHYSKVTIDLQQDPSVTSLTLLQTEVPESDVERTKQGWKRYIFEAIKATFGFGTPGPI